MISAEKAYKLLKNKIARQRKEYLVVLSFDAKDKLLAVNTVVVGTQKYLKVYPREVFEPAIAKHGCKIMLAHNHPSGLLQPSKEDLALTKKIIVAGKLLGIKVLDHLIISRTGYLSLKQSGWWEDVFDIN